MNTSAIHQDHSILD